MIPRPFYYTTKVSLVDFVALLITQAIYWTNEEISLS